MVQLPLAAESGKQKSGCKNEYFNENSGFLCSFELFSQLKGNSRNDGVCFKVYNSF